MSKTRKFLTTLTIVAVATTASFSAVSSAQAHFGPWLPAHPHLVPGPFIPGPLFPVPPPPGPPAPPAHDHGTHHHGLNSGQSAALGLLGGVILGSVLANANKQPAQPAPAAGLPAQHYIFCDNKYQSYVAATDSYTGFDGLQHRCNSPYVY